MAQVAPEGGEHVVEPDGACEDHADLRKGLAEGPQVVQEIHRLGLPLPGPDVLEHVGDLVPEEDQPVLLLGHKVPQGGLQEELPVGGQFLGKLDLPELDPPELLGESPGLSGHFSEPAQVALHVPEDGFHELQGGLHPFQVPVESQEARPGAGGHLFDETAFSHAPLGLEDQALPLQDPPDPPDQVVPAHHLFGRDLAAWVGSHGNPFLRGY